MVRGYVVDAIIYRESVRNRGKCAFSISFLLLNESKNSMDVSEKCIVMQHKIFTFRFEFFPGFVELELIVSISVLSSDIHQLEGSLVLNFQVNRRISK